jgi:hypothetical protein
MMALLQILLNNNNNKVISGVGPLHTRFVTSQARSFLSANKDTKLQTIAKAIESSQ